MTTIRIELIGKAVKNSSKEANVFVHVKCDPLLVTDCTVWNRCKMALIGPLNGSFEYNRTVYHRNIHQCNANKTVAQSRDAVVQFQVNCSSYSHNRVRLPQHDSSARAALMALRHTLTVARPYTRHTVCMTQVPIGPS